MAISPSVRAGESWSETELVDVQSGLAFGTSVEEIAEFLARDVDEVRQKIAAIRLKSDGNQPGRLV
jgi:hypothetical protein